MQTAKPRFKKVSKKAWKPFDLCPLEVREARTPTTAGLFPLEIREIRPPDAADLLPVAPKAEKVQATPGWRKIQATVDSGCQMSTAKRDAAPGYTVTPSEMSKRGQCVVNATNH